MSVGPMAGLAASVAATSLAQNTGSDVERTQQATGNQQRQVRNEQRAVSAAGIGETDGDNHETNDRDADGRRPWERSELPNASSEPSTGLRLSRDASHQSGNLLDLSG